ncbi:MAG: peptidylprolyl isomerase [Chitinophagales bacterium]|jgi:peptidyl-prolyl cis-trans isomerase SurA|nr:peptidylprolyl isomerase [Chitinophagales bacterium]
MRLFPILLLFFLFHISLDGYAQKLNVDKSIAFVDKYIILKSDIQNYTKLDSRDSCEEDCDVLKNLIIDKMILTKARRDSVLATEAEINSELERRFTYFSKVFGNEENLESYYGFSIKELKSKFRDDMEHKIQIDKTKSKLLSRIDPTPKEVKAYFEQLPKHEIPNYNSEVKLQQIIFVPKISRESMRLLRVKANEVRQKLIKKEVQFSTQAILYSNDPGSATNGGELGWVTKGQMVPAFERACFLNPVGEISDIVETQYGYHIIEVMERKGEKAKARHILFSAKPSDQDIQNTKLLADSIRTKILANRLSFEKAVELYSEDPYFKANGGVLINMDNGNSYFTYGQIEDEELNDLVNKMEVGEISEPASTIVPGGKVGFRIVKLMQKTNPHLASLSTDYARIKEECQQNMVKKALEEWANQFKSFIFIKVKQDYLDKCPNLSLFQAQMN